MTAKSNVVTLYQNPSAGNPSGLDAPSGGLVGFGQYPTIATIKRAADGTALSATPAVDATNGPVKSVTRNGAGDYTVVLADMAQTAAQVAPRLSLDTASLYGTVVVTDATHLAILCKTDAGVATDSIFTLAIDFLNLP